MEEIKDLLDEIGLELSDFPGLGLLVPLWLLVFQIVKWLLSQTAIVKWLLPQTAADLIKAILESDILLLLLAIIFSIFIYTLGNIWDGIFYDPRYEPGNGPSKWYPTFLLCSFNKLDTPRKRAASVLIEEAYEKVQENGKNAYAEAQKMLTKNGKWNEVRGKLNWSKTIRSLIFPSLFTATFCAILAACLISSNWGKSPIILLAIFWVYTVISSLKRWRELKDKEKISVVLAFFLLLLIMSIAILIGCFHQVPPFTLTSIFWLVLIAAIACILAFLFLILSTNLRAGHSIKMYDLVVSLHTPKSSSPTSLDPPNHSTA